jgi:ribose transport system ATP-binding protein
MREIAHMNGHPAAEMQHINKSFRGIHALRDVSFELRAGEVHALVGENGAGKSTLMRILAGACQKDSGVIRIQGRPVEIRHPSLARKLGIGIINQEFALAPDLSVAENIFLGNLSDRKGWISRQRLYRKSEALIRRLGFDINPRSRVGDLSVAYQQVVEICKALFENLSVLILDEPTAVLSPRDADSLFVILRTLKQQGVAICYISHRLEEVFRIADRITVAKDGRIAGTVLPREVTPDAVIRLMIGRSLTSMYPVRNYPRGAEILQVRGVTCGGKVHNVSFTVRAGEVLGIAGLVGSGRTELVRAVFGADSKDSGQIFLQGRSVRMRSPRDAVRQRLGLLPEDRKEHGVLLDLSVRENLTLSNLKSVVNKVGFLQVRKEKRIAENLVKRLGIRVGSAEQLVSELSGGNQQKVALAKWFHADCRAIILDEPTRGVDVGARIEIYTLINELARKGLALIIVSSDLLEIIGMCDRVIVMSQGRVAGFLEKTELSEENIMALAMPSSAGLGRALDTHPEFAHKESSAAS